MVDPPIGPHCLKGVEIYDGNFVEVNIRRAIQQLSYAFINKVINSIYSQIDENDMFTNTIFLKVPVIITNADLHLVREEVTTREIKNAKNIEDVSQSHDFLLFHNKVGENLKAHNRAILESFFTGEIKERAENQLQWHDYDLNHFINVMSELSPESILIMHHDKEHSNYTRLLNCLKLLTVDSEGLKNQMQRVKNEDKERDREFKEMANKRKKTMHNRVDGLPPD